MLNVDECLSEFIDNVQKMKNIMESCRIFLQILRTFPESSETLQSIHFSSQHFTSRPSNDLLSHAGGPGGGGQLAADAALPRGARSGGSRVGAKLANWFSPHRDFIFQEAPYARESSAQSRVPGR